MFVYNILFFFFANRLTRLRSQMNKYIFASVVYHGHSSKRSKHGSGIFPLRFGTNAKNSQSFTIFLYVYTVHKSFHRKSVTARANRTLDVESSFNLSRSVLELAESEI